MDFLHFFVKGRKLLEKMIHQNNNRGHETSTTVKFRKGIAMAIWPIIVKLFNLIFISEHAHPCMMRCANLRTQ